MTTENILAIIAIVISIAAAVFSCISHNLARKAHKLAEKSYTATHTPTLKLLSMLIDPDKIEVYVGDSKNIDDYKKDSKAYVDCLNSTFLEKLATTSSSDSLTSFKEHISGNKKDFLLINLCKTGNKETLINQKKTILALNVLSLTFENIGPPITEISILEAYSISKNKVPFGKELKFNYKLYPEDGNKITIDLAYAYPEDEATSLYIKEMLKLEMKMDLLKYRGSAGKYIGFIDSCYLFSCKTANSESFLFTMAYELDPKTHMLKQYHMYSGRSEYDSKVKNAIENYDNFSVIKKQ